MPKSTNFPYLSLMKFTMPGAKAIDNKGEMGFKNLLSSSADAFSSNKKTNLELYNLSTYIIDNCNVTI